jgi:glycosyltransferase involved in cell wall biosynthesis
MINGKRIAVVMPAFNAEKTLEKTVQELSDVVDIKILVDDSSKDRTAELSRRLGVRTFVHDANYGYGRNQQTCYREALAAGADIVVMVHPDYQYTPSLVPAMAGMIASGVYDMVLGSRILGAGALKGGMPLYKYISNRFLTAFQNIFLGVKLSEYHTGFRAFSRELLETLPLLENSSSTTRWSPRPSCSASGSAKSPARRSTSKRLPPSTSAAASNTALASSAPRLASSPTSGA